MVLQWWYRAQRLCESCCLISRILLYIIIFTEKLLTNKTLLSDTVSAVLCTVLMWFDLVTISSSVLEPWSLALSSVLQGWRVWWAENLSRPQVTLSEGRAKPVQGAFIPEQFQNQTLSQALLILCILGSERGTLSIQHCVFRYRQVNLLVSTLLDKKNNKTYIFAPAHALYAQF